MDAATITWLGHASFRIDSPGGKRIYIDPWLGNPKCPESEREPERIGETVELAQRFGCPVIALLELRGWLESKGAPGDMSEAPNKGGTTEKAGIKFTLTNAFHSSSSPEGEYLGEAAGLVVRLEDDAAIYFAGDTCVFGDMQLIGRMYAPDVAVLPIGGHFTMDPQAAAVALELLGVKQCIPSHYGTFPILAGTPEELQTLAPDAEVIALEPGESHTL